MPELISGSATVNSSNSNIVHPILPAVVGADDLLFATGRMNNNTMGGFIFPGDWTPVPLVNWQGYGSHFLIWKAADGTEDGITLDVTNDIGISAPWTTETFSISGADRDAPIEDQDSNMVSAQPLTIPALTTAGPDRLIIMIGSQNPAGTFTDYVVWGQGTEFFESVAGTTRVISGAFLSQPTAGSSGALTATFAATTPITGGYAVAIKPPPPAARVFARRWR